jgi:transmembrane secretion effector
MLAGPLVASGRFDVAFGAYAVSASTAGLLVARMRLSPWERDSEEALGILGRIASGFEHARERHPALPALAMTALLSVFGASHVTVLSIYAQDRLGDISWFPWIVSAIGAGALVGALVTGTRRPRLRSAAWRTLAYGVLLAGFGLVSHPALAIGLEALIGYCYFAVMTELQTLIQGIVDEPMRGRVMSLFQVCWAGLIPFGSLGMGATAGALGVGPTLVLAGSACAAGGLWMALRAEGTTRRILGS